jgi:hypothetical protein
LTFLLGRNTREYGDVIDPINKVEGIHDNQLVARQPLTLDAEFPGDCHCGTITPKNKRFLSDSYSRFLAAYCSASCGVIGLMQTLRAGREAAAPQARLNPDPAFQKQAR